MFGQQGPRRKSRSALAEDFVDFVKSHIDVYVYIDRYTEVTQGLHRDFYRDYIGLYGGLISTRPSYACLIFHPWKPEASHEQIRQKGRTT